MTEIAETPAQLAARAGLRVAVGAMTEALEVCGQAGLDAQGEMMRMIQEAFAQAGQEVPPLLRMILG